ncbi:TetR/AcrR family transcriptional regulator [Carboxylicivirga taeanensis]|uniref:TetR/AcrR family transcriptional regulator n=1 Tax=Carboxylicivirga taeanensis TaxID=1416875 RepID=UPI003F6E25E2
MKTNKPQERILDTAKELFHKQGYNSTGINQIIRDSKVAKASFYDHYKSKEELAIAYLNHRHNTWLEGLQHELSQVENTHGKILKAFDYLKTMNIKEDFSGCVFLNMLAELKTSNLRIHQIIQEHKTEVQNLFSELIENETTAFHVFMLFESCLIESQVYRSQQPIEKTILLLKNMIL